MRRERTIYFLTTLVIIFTACQHSNPLQYPIAFSSKTSGDIELYLTDAAGKSKIKVTNRPGNDGYVAWSPDGKQLACYAYHDGRKTWSIHTMHTDGSNRKRLTHAKNKWDSAPAWSPDGHKIVFARAYKDSLQVWQEELWIMNADGSEPSQIKPLTGGGACFTPSGHLVFHANLQSYEICMADVDGSNFKQLTHNDAKEFHPEVSPDGQQVAFMSDRDGNFEIYTMHIDGSNQRRLTFNNHRDNTPSWSADGSKIIFHSSGDTEEKHVYMMNADGTSLEKLIINASGAAWYKAVR